MQAGRASREENDVDEALQFRVPPAPAEPEAPAAYGALAWVAGGSDQVFSPERDLHHSRRVGYLLTTQVISGTIMDRKVVVEELFLPEGTVVTILARGDEPLVRLSAEQEAALLDALDEADRGERVSAEAFLVNLRPFG